jgi:hypothetical protein
MNRRLLVKLSFILSLFISFLVLPTAYSDWVIADVGSNEGDIADSETQYTVSIKNVIQTEEETVGENVEDTSFTDTSGSDTNSSSTDCPFTKEGKTLTKGTNTFYNNRANEVKDYDADGNYIGYHFDYLVTTYNVSVSKKKRWELKYTRTYTASRTKTQHTFRVTMTILDDISTISLRTGDLVPEYFLSRENLSNPDGYDVFAGFYSDVECSVLFQRINNPISSNLTIYARRNSSGSSLGDDVNNLSSSKDYYVGSLNGFDISSADAYSNSNVILSSSDNLTVKNGATVNFCMNTGATNIEGMPDTTIENPDLSRSGSTSGYLDNYLSLDYGGTGSTPSSSSKNNKSYTVVLGNDLTINGSMYIGGYTGSTSNSMDYQGMIIGPYVELDLYGHTVTINDGGLLHSFGNITDSIGGGKIVVNAGGTLKTQLVLYEIKGGNNSIWSYAKGLCPFEDYSLPYLDCTVEFPVTSSGVGTLVAFTKLDLGSLGICNVYVDFIGYKDTNYIFNIFGTNDANNDGKIVLSHRDYDDLKTASGNNVYYDSALIYQRQNVTFKNVSFEFSSKSKINANIHIEKSVDIIGDVIMDQAFSIDVGRVVFPISSMFDILMLNSTFNLKQKIKLMPGASLYLDDSSYLNLGVNSLDSYTVKVSKTILIYTVSKSFTLSAIKTSGGIVGLERIGEETYSIHKSSYYSSIWKENINDDSYYYAQPNISVLGTVVFSANSGYDPFILSGKMYIDKFKMNGNVYRWTTNNIYNYLYGSSSINVQTYDFNLLSLNSYRFGTASEILDSSNDSAYLWINRFFAMPATINGVGYIFKNGKYSIYGDYDYDTGIFTSNENKTYFFKLPSTLLEDNSDQDSSIDYSLTPIECTNDTSKHTVTVDGDGTYVFSRSLNAFLKVSDSTSNTDTSKLVDASIQWSKTDAKTATLTYSNGYRTGSVR